MQTLVKIHIPVQGLDIVDIFNTVALVYHWLHVHTQIKMYKQYLSSHSTFQ